MLILLLTIEDLEAADRLVLLYRKYSGLLYIEAYDLLNNREDAEDAVADTFEALMKRKSLPDPDDPGTTGLLVTIVRRRSFNIFKDRGPRRMQHSEAPSDIASSSGSPEHILAIQEAFALLPADEREALTLFVYYGYTTAEIAAQKGLKQDTIQKRIKRARERLKAYLKDGR